MESTVYTRDEEARLARALRRGERVECPRCRAPLERRDVPPDPGLPYVRDRVWLVCGRCRRSAVLERVGRGPDEG